MVSGRANVRHTLSCVPGRRLDLDGSGQREGEGEGEGLFYPPGIVETGKDKMCTTAAFC